MNRPANQLLCLADDAAAATRVRVAAPPSATSVLSIVVEQRKRDRRARDRRAPQRTANPERRQIRALTGRRIADRRAQVERLELPLPQVIEAIAAVRGVDVVERIAHSRHYLRDVRGTTLALRFQTGDRDAFDEIYSLYFTEIQSSLEHMLDETSDAEDIAQQVFVKVHGALPRFEARGPSFGKWLSSIARNAALDVVRGRRHAIAVDPNVVGSLIDSRLDREHAQGSPTGDFDVRVLVDALPDDQRTVLLLRYDLGFSAQDVADLLGRTPAAISGARHRALIALENGLRAAGHPAAKGPPVRKGRVRPLPALA